MELQGQANALSLIEDTQYSVSGGIDAWQTGYCEGGGGDATAARLAMEEQGQANALSLIDDTQYEVEYGTESGDFGNDLI